MIIFGADVGVCKGWLLPLNLFTMNRVILTAVCGMHLRFSSPLPAFHTAEMESRRRMVVYEAPVSLRC